MKSVAPYQSCMSCFRGDTTTAIYFEGEAEWIIAAVQHFAALSMEEATRSFEKYAGCDPGEVPSGRMAVGMLLCPECAAKTDARLLPVTNRERRSMIPPGYCYMQPVEAA